MSTSSTALNGRARAKAHRRGHLASVAPAAPQEPIAAPMPAQTPIEKPVETSASTASFLQVSPERKAKVDKADKAVVVAQGREAAKQRRQQLVSGTASSGTASNRPQPRTKPKPEPILPSTKEASNASLNTGLTLSGDRAKDKSKDKSKGSKTETSETAMGRKLQVSHRAKALAQVLQQLKGRGAL